MQQATIQEIVNPAISALKSIKMALQENRKVIPIDAHLYFTKGDPGKISGSLFRDFELEESVISWLESRVSFKNVMQRYKHYDNRLSSLEWPLHYATRFINMNGSASNGENIFMFFPEVLGLKTGKVEDYFGFEFIDIWVSVFDEIVFPCVRRVFDHETQLELYASLRPVLEKTIYLASIFHEIGHRCGDWKVSPVVDERINVNKFHMDVLGELATDSLLANLLLEFPEIKYFIFLQRIFWFGRFDFRKNPQNGKLNQDNDAWIGAYLWNKYIEQGVLVKNANGSWRVDFAKLDAFFSIVVDDVDRLGSECINQKINQDDVVQSWMQSRVLFLNNKFYLPESMREVFWRCASIIEKPVRKY